MLLSLISSNSDTCLDADFRRVTLNEPPAQAEARAQACQACPPGFFQYLDEADISKRPYATEPYLKAWRDYQQCLAANGWND